MDQEGPDEKIITLYEHIAQSADRNRQLLNSQERELHRIHDLFKDHHREDERKTMLLLELNRQQQEFGDIQRQMIEILAAISLRLELQEAMLKEVFETKKLLSAGLSLGNTLKEGAPEGL